MDVAHASQADRKSQLDQMLGQAVQQTGGKTLVNQPYKAGSVTGYEFRFQFDRKGKTVESRQVHFFVGDRQYTVVMEMDTAGQSQYAQAFEIVLQLSNAKAGGTLTGTWIADRVNTTWQPDEKIYEKSVNTEAGNFQGYFSVTSTKDFPPGDYGLEIRLDGKLLRRVSLHAASSRSLP